MNTFYALSVLAGLLFIIVSIPALFAPKIRRKAAVSLAFGVAVFVVAANKFVPDRSAVTTTDRTASAISGLPQGDVVTATTPVASSNDRVPGIAGTARVCVTDANVKFGTLNIPKTATFEDLGNFKGSKDDVSTWAVEGGRLNVAFELIEPVLLTKQKPCATAKVQIQIGPLKGELAAKANDNRMYVMSDVREYPIPSTKPDVEIGSLIDDMSVNAVLLSDVTATVTLPQYEQDDATSRNKCLEGAQKLAASINAVIGRQTSSIVALAHRSTNEASFGCPSGPKSTSNIFIAWDRRAKPPADTLELIAKAGAFLTGATAIEVSQATAACVTNALKPKSQELAAVEFRGARVECQAFSRDGGGGNVTIYRRFGAEPLRDPLQSDVQQKLMREAEALRLKEAAEAEKSVAFAKWWLDETIPTKVKTFTGMAARMIALAERCPSWKLRPEKIEQMASWAGVETSDIKPGGRYFGLLAEMLVVMRSGTKKESVKEACETARKYDVD